MPRRKLEIVGLAPVPGSVLAQAIVIVARIPASNPTFFLGPWAEGAMACRSSPWNRRQPAELRDVRRDEAGLTSGVGNQFEELVVYGLWPRNVSSVVPYARAGYRLWLDSKRRVASATLGL